MRSLNYLNCHYFRLLSLLNNLHKIKGGGIAALAMNCSQFKKYETAKKWMIFNKYTDEKQFGVLCPLNQSIEDQVYYFCCNSDCNIVYFGENGKQYCVDQIRGCVGQKQTSMSRPICYCFDVTAQQLLDEINNTGRSHSKIFVMTQTKAKSCACDIHNPSGACCLADFPSKPM